ncbi:MAG: hemolysin family protein, partial [Gemmatimonadota bacterium]
MSQIAAEIFIILLLLVFNGIFAMSEIAVVAARKVRLEQRADEGDRGARAALDLAHEPTAFLSTVQVGITLIGVLAGAFGGASIAEQLADMLRPSAVGAYADGIGLALVVSGITYASLVIGELAPKRIALGAPERIAAIVARPMRVLATVASPLVRLLTASTNVLLRLVGVSAAKDTGVTEEEIRALVEQAEESGAVRPEEREVVEGAFRLGDREAGMLMTPRPDVAWLDLTESADHIRQHLMEQRGEHVLVCREAIDEV